MTDTHTHTPAYHTGPNPLRPEDPLFYSPAARVDMVCVCVCVRVYACVHVFMAGLHTHDESEQFVRVHALTTAFPIHTTHNPRLTLMINLKEKACVCLR